MPDTLLKAMSITSTYELEGMQKVSEAVGTALREMRSYVKPGMTSRQLDDFGAQVLRNFGARSAPMLTYGFPGWTCISINQEMAHGIPSDKKIFREGDLVNIDVSAELNGFWSDNGGSFVLGEGTDPKQRLVDTSRRILREAIHHIRAGVRISEIGRLIETGAKKAGYKVIKNLTGHGIGKSLHEAPHEIANYCNPLNRERFRKNEVVAIETFISTHSSIAYTTSDGWTLVGNRGGYVAQHEHTILVTDSEALVLTEMNGIWDAEM